MRKSVLLSYLCFLFPVSSLDLLIGSFPQVEDQEGHPDLSILSHMTQKAVVCLCDAGAPA